MLNRSLICLLALFAGQLHSPCATAQQAPARDQSSQSELRLDAYQALAEFSLAADSKPDSPTRRITLYLEQQRTRTREAASDRESALIELLSLAVGIESDSDLAPAYWLERARLLRTLDLLEPAVTICDRLDGRKQATAAVATERLQIADAWISLGGYVQAEQQLRLAQAKLPKLSRPDWRHTYGKLLLAQARPADAVAMIGELDQTTEALRVINASKQAPSIAPLLGMVTRFNLAVAMLRSADEQRGLSWLDLIGRSKVFSAEALALRDRANLALGWHFLSGRQGRTAVGVLGRIRGEGPFSNPALLGMGWAQLEPHGERTRRETLDTGRTQASKPGDLPPSVRTPLIRLAALQPELNGAVEPASFAREDPPRDRAEGLQKAITIWRFLTTRDPRDSAVQEALLASAYAYDQLGDPAAARNAYASAVAALQAVKSEIDIDRASVAKGVLSAMIADAEPAALYASMDQFHLPADGSTVALYAAIDRYQELTRLQARVDQANTAPIADTDLSHRLAVASETISGLRVATGAALESLAAQAIDARRERVDDYLRSALLLAARAESE